MIQGVRGVYGLNSKIDIPVWEKYTMTVEEASKYFTLGQNKIRWLAEQNRHADWYIMNGNRLLIKKKQFEKSSCFIFVDKLWKKGKCDFIHELKNTKATR